MDNPPIPPPPPPTPPEQAAWVPQTPGAGQPVPTAVPKRGMHWFFKVLIGCGVLFILLPILAMAALVAINPLDKLEKARQEYEKTATSSAQAKEIKEDTSYTSGWQTINGQISEFQGSKVYKFSLKAPTDFKTYAPYPNLSAEQSKNYFGAKNSSTDLFVGIEEGPGVQTALGGSALQEIPCEKPLVVTEFRKSDSFEVCDNLKVAGKNALYLLEVNYGRKYSEDPMSCDAVESNFYVVFNLDKYHGVIFTTKLDVLKEVTKPWDTSLANRIAKGETFKNDPSESCSTSEESNQVKNSFSSNIQNIRNAENLSSGDLTAIKNLYQMLATFKLL